MAESKKQITLQLDLQEVNTILKALGAMPFMEVYRIIEKIHVQASEPAALPAKPAPRKTPKRKN